ncbi:MAG: HEAT repeat domain-containing protein [Deltaproteobacteria bacterium]|nr:HEAT repeat domain-containing protein [Deltaproteobacteria bacterium]
MHDEMHDILNRLRSDDPSVIREAAFDAGEIGCRQAISVLSGLLSSSNLGVQEAADHALRKLGGPDTIEAVTPLLRVDDAPVRNLAMDILRQIGNQDVEFLVMLLEDEDPDIRIFAADILGSCDDYRAVSPLCRALLRDEEVNVRYQAAVSLGELAKPEAAGCLNEAMNDDEWVQFAVIEALMKVKDDSSINAMILAMGKSTELVASMIIDALGEMGNVKAVPLLMKKLDESPTALRNKIIKAIVGIMGGKALGFLSEGERDKFRHYLLAAADDEDMEIQDAAVAGLASVGGAPATKKILGLAEHLDPDRDMDRLLSFERALADIDLNDHLAEGAASEKETVAALAIRALRRIGNAEAVGVLMDIFSGRDRDQQREISAALAEKSGGEAKEFMIRLLETTNDGDMLKSALSFLGSKMRYADCGTMILPFLEHPFNDVKEAALEACVSIGGEMITSRFMEMSKSNDPLHRMMAAYAFGRIGARDHVEQLRRALEDEEPDIRKFALEAMGGLCSEDPEILKLVSARMYDENRDVRLSLVDMLGRCERPEVEGLLLSALEDSDDWVKIRAVEAVGLRSMASTVPGLVEMLRSTNQLVAMKAAEALGRIGGQSAFRALLDVLDEAEPDLAATVEDALDRIQSDAEEGLD